ncbi:hypothetical protein AMS68_001649 [Peltaster fructicola]|uniref:Exonuclease domain-containing protein n=1 Tax=Peltaster fructicola TaxID=286661 RepID=A0A6H0XMZ8_9PEZI|nr:hypothetical protein AMS68_001649 [Peltaster fructicola]
MVFISQTELKDVPCPAIESCDAVICGFNHSQQSKKGIVTTQRTDSMHAGSMQDDSSGRLTDDGRSGAKEKGNHQESPIEPPSKRRKVTPGTPSLSRADQLRAQVVQTRTQQTAPLQQSSPSVVCGGVIDGVVPGDKQTTLTRPISPPTTSHTADVKPLSAEDYSKAAQSMLSRFVGDKTESLNPRVVTPAPEAHNKRTVFCQHIHSHMTRLNRDILASRAPIRSIDSVLLKNFVLSNPALIKLTLDEEESIAKETPKIYGNVIRNRVAAYSRMSIDTWLEKLQTTIFMGLMQEAHDPVTPSSSAALAAVLKLSAADMHVILERLKVTDLHTLTSHGYVFEPPTETAAKEAQSGRLTSRLFERCDRCNSHFQVFPDRDPETGRLTSNGPCHFHWGRQNYARGGTTTYRCCGQEVGTVGCTSYPDHVFKTTFAPSLAAVLPFIKTPDNNNRRKDPKGQDVLGVVFDCEMAYTTNGHELIRLTAVSWPSKEPLLDFLVRPLGAIIDLNTRFSGVKAEWFSKAMPYEKDKPTGGLQVVSDPAAARSLLCEFLDGDKVPLMGHAIENDLIAVRLCHNNIVDTVVLYPHRRGLPARNGLKALTSEHLKRDIQMGGSDGHDSFEDAAATLDLILLKAEQIATSL